MKHYIYFEGRAAEVDTERAFTCALIGKRNPLSETPKGLEISEFGVHTIDGRPSAEWTAVEKAAVRTFKIALTDKGRYNSRVLDWFETQEAAEAAFAAWSTWLDLRVAQVSTTIP